MKNIRSLFKKCAVFACIGLVAYPSFSIAGSYKSLGAQLTGERKISDPNAPRPKVDKQEVKDTFGKATGNGLYSVLNVISAATNFPMADMMVHLFIEGRCGTQSPGNLGMAEANTFIEYVAKYGDRLLSFAKDHPSLFKSRDLKKVKSAHEDFIKIGGESIIGSDKYWRWADRHARAIVGSRKRTARGNAVDRGLMGVWPIQAYFISQRIPEDKKYIERAVGRKISGYACCRSAYKDGLTVTIERIRNGEAIPYTGYYKELRDILHRLIKDYEHGVAFVLARDSMLLTDKHPIVAVVDSPVLKEALHNASMYDGALPVQPIFIDQKASDKKMLAIK